MDWPKQRSWSKWYRSLDVKELQSMIYQQWSFTCKVPFGKIPRRNLWLDRGRLLSTIREMEKQDTPPNLLNRCHRFVEMVESCEHFSEAIRSEAAEVLKSLRSLDQ